MSVEKTEATENGINIATGQDLTAKTNTLSFLSAVPLKYYKIDFDKVNTLDDVKRILGSMKINFAGSYTDDIKDLLIEIE